MIFEVTPDQRTDLEKAAAHARQTRSWKRCRAFVLLEGGLFIAQVSAALDRGLSTTRGRVARWRTEGSDRLAKGAHRLDAAASIHL